jgi:threonine/homoserine/homoserine lactone efflux protein
MDLFVSMAAFALAASISPGPVNLVGLASGMQYGLRAGMRHVTGATVGFTLLLVIVGFGVNTLLHYLPSLIGAIKWAGAAFLLYMAYKLAVDDGRLETSNSTRGPSLYSGAAMQWLNPKAWLASLAGMGAYVGSGSTSLIWTFAAIYFVICYASLASWVVAGMFLRKYLGNPKRMQWLNRTLAVLLVLSTFYLIRE